MIYMQYENLKKKYFEKSKSLVKPIKLLPKKTYNISIIIPALMESQNIKKLLRSLEKNEKNILSKTAVIFVINNSENAPREIKEDNKKLSEFLESNNGKNLNIGYIDVYSNENALPEKIAGVGTARKIGADSFIYNFEFESSEPKIIVFLDADCIVSENYLSTISNFFKNTNFYFATINYSHYFIEDIEINEAIAYYESFLRYYTLSLKRARSPYSFHAIGSTIAFLTEGYLKIGGMNQKKAGEDFYFLEKARKTFEIGYIPEVLVFPSPRKSFRVPFGTGRAIADILSGRKSYKQFLSFDNFEILKKWNEVFLEKNYLDEKKYLLEAEKITSHLLNFLLLSGFEKDFKEIFRDRLDEKKLLAKKIEWFDALKTLKLLHYLRNNLKPDEDWNLSLKKLFNALNENIQSSDIFESLNLLRTIYNKYICYEKRY